MVDADADGRTPDHGHPISSPYEPYGSGELINISSGTNCLSLLVGWGMGNVSESGVFLSST